ncbi:ABC transporter ATP-binding protein [uncultured Helicobacter sp.]|uniref:ABC transporter ATP-binding protein n=1 Tax=uncultured Helicobacter sp. TaxID=175537 RepID=UPI00260817BD|nr:ABC transporter ATP-binding protein [uncultured Helicobacter sp.]
MLRIDNASFYRIYKGKKQEILRNINCTLQEGEVLSILGRNGAGKTTLLKCMVGLLKWSAGESLLMGKALGHYTHKEMWKIISYVPQAKTYSFDMKVLDMVALGCNPFVGIKPKAKHFEDSLAMLDELKLSHLAQKWCLALSGGELQMVLFARALVKKPRVLILDEPESNLDFFNQKTICDTLKQCSQNGVSVILNTHFPSHARFLSHKAILLHKIDDSFHSSTNATFGDAKAILSESALSALYNVRLHLSPQQDEYVLRI